MTQNAVCCLPAHSLPLTRRLPHLHKYFQSATVRCGPDWIANVTASWDPESQPLAAVDSGICATLTRMYPGAAAAAGAAAAGAETSLEQDGTGGMVVDSGGSGLGAVAGEMEDSLMAGVRNTSAAAAAAVATSSPASSSVGPLLPIVESPSGQCPVPQVRGTWYVPRIGRIACCGGGGLACCGCGLAHEVAYLPYRRLHCLLLPLTYFSLKLLIHLLLSCSNNLLHLQEVWPGYNRIRVPLDTLNLVSLAPPDCSRWIARLAVCNKDLARRVGCCSHDCALAQRSIPVVSRGCRRSVYQCRLVCDHGTNERLVTVVPKCANVLATSLNPLNHTVSQSLSRLLLPPPPSIPPPSRCLFVPDATSIFLLT